jgi:hypothetical protein
MSLILTLNEERFLATKINDYVLPPKTIWKTIYEKKKPQKQQQARDYYHRHPEECKTRSKDRYKKKKVTILKQAKIRNPIDFQKNKTQILARRIKRNGYTSINSHASVSFEILNSLLVSKI